MIKCFKITIVNMLKNFWHIFSLYCKHFLKWMKTRGKIKLFKLFCLRYLTNLTNELSTKVYKLSFIYIFAVLFD
jgi:hypothetical protein